jgi:hypothetical protein
MILVTSCGRTGTNLVLEILTGSKELVPSRLPEDKLVYEQNVTYPHYYLTKCDIHYCKNYETFRRFMYKNPDSSIIWTIRNPKDIILSKLRRGWMKSEDGTPNECLDNIFYTWHFYMRAIKEFDNNILTVRMEDVILDIKSEVNRMCKFIGIRPNILMYYPHKRMRHIGKRERYKSLDVTQVDLWKQYYDVYNGFFKDKDVDLDYMFKTVKPMTKYFGYKE